MVEFTLQQQLELHKLVSSAPAEALKIIRKYQDEGVDDKRFLLSQNGWLIDIGAALNDAELIKECIAHLENIVSTLTDDDFASQYGSGLHYDLSNGYSTLVSIERKEQKIFQRDSLIRKAKNSLRKAIKTIPENRILSLPEMLVNYGNCLSRVGRHVEAIQQYELALKLNEKHSMALGNLAIELDFFTAISGDPFLLTEAISLMNTALEGDVEDKGTAYARHEFIEALKRMEAKKEGLEKANGPIGVPPQPKEEKRSEAVTDYVEFCRLNHLFLNFTTQNRGIRSERDSITPDGIIVPINDQGAAARVYMPLNEIKEKYVTARLLLYEACYPLIPTKEVNQLTTYTWNMDYGVYGVHVGKMKMTIESAFNILDKIALFLNRYLQINRSEDSLTFVNFWQTDKDNADIPNEILQINSHPLGALYDIYVDLMDDEKLKRLKRMRNLSTHRYLLPHYLEPGKTIQADKEKYHINYADMPRDCIEALRLARSAIIYLTAFVNSAERAKHIPGRLIAPMFSLPYEHYDIDPLDAL